MTIYRWYHIILNQGLFLSPSILPLQYYAKQGFWTLKCKLLKEGNTLATKFGLDIHSIIKFLLQIEIETIEKKLLVVFLLSKLIFHCYLISIMLISKIIFYAIIIFATKKKKNCLTIQLVHVLL